MEHHWADLSAELLHAAAHDETQRLQSLIVAGASLDVKGWLRNRPLHIACARGKLSAVELLLRSGARVNAVNAGRATPLHEAAVRGASSCAEACVMFGADCSAADRFGSTPLHAAARHGHLELVRLLLSAGSDHTARDELGMSPRQLAKQQARASRHSGVTFKSSVAVFSEIARVLAEENLETTAASLLLRARQVCATVRLAFRFGHFVPGTDLVPCGLPCVCAQRLVWATAMHPRLGGGSDTRNRRVASDKSPAHILSFDLVYMVVGMLPASLDYSLVRRHRREQQQLARDARGRQESSSHRAKAADYRRDDKQKVNSDSGDEGTACDSKSKPRRRHRLRRQTDDTGISLAEMYKAQAAAVAAATAGEVVRVQPCSLAHRPWLQRAVC